jgi:hypothetical protein
MQLRVLARQQHFVAGVAMSPRHKVAVLSSSALSLAFFAIYQRVFCMVVGARIQVRFLVFFFACSIVLLARALAARVFASVAYARAYSRVFLSNFLHSSTFATRSSRKKASSTCARSERERSESGEGVQRGRAACGVRRRSQRARVQRVRRY